MGFGVLLLFCLALSPATLSAWGAGAGIAGAVLALATWTELGPPLFPGLLPGMMGLLVYGWNLAWAAKSVLAWLF